MKTLTEYADLIDKHKQVPHYLAELSEEMAADYARYTEELVNVKLLKPKEWVEIKKSKMKETESGWEGKPLSDKLTEMIWRSTPAGRREVILKGNVKALEKCMSSIKTHIYNLNQESFSQ